MDERNGAMVNGALMTLGVVEQPHGTPSPGAEPAIGLMVSGLQREA